MLIISACHDWPVHSVQGNDPYMSLYVDGHGHYFGPFRVLGLATAEEWLAGIRDRHVRENTPLEIEAATDRLRRYYAIHVD